MLLNLRVPWTAGRSNQSILKEINPIHWKDWCWSWKSNTLATWCKELTHWKRPWCWKRQRAVEEGGDRGRNGWMTSFNGHEFEQTPGDGEGQRSLDCYSPWGRKESHKTEWLNSNNNTYCRKIKKHASKRGKNKTDHQLILYFFFKNVNNFV